MEDQKDFEVFSSAVGWCFIRSAMVELQQEGGEEGFRIAVEYCIRQKGSMVGMSH